MANDMRYLSAEEEAKLLKPIDEYVGKIQAQIDALRVDGSDQVQALKTHISLTKEDKNYTKEEQNEIIRKDQALLVKAREVEAANKDKVSKLIADAESYLKTHFKKDYYDNVVASCAAQKEDENAEYVKVREKLKAEHERTISGMTDKQELKDEKYVYKNRLYDAQMVHESKLQEIKDRKHEAFVHQYHLIDLLRMSKFTYGQKKLQKLENYKYTFNTPQFLYKNGLYIVIILIFIALCFITPVVKDTQLLTTANILNILQQASPRIFLALGVAGLILLTGTDLSVGRMVGMGMVTATIIMHNGINTGGVFGHIFDFTGIPAPARAIFALLVCVILTTGFASIAGFFMARFKMHPFTAGGNDVRRDSRGGGTQYRDSGRTYRGDGCSCKACHFRSGYRENEKQKNSFHRRCKGRAGCHHDEMGRYGRHCHSCEGMGGRLAAVSDRGRAAKCAGNEGVSFCREGI